MPAALSTGPTRHRFEAHLVTAASRTEQLTMYDGSTPGILELEAKVGEVLGFLGPRCREEHNLPDSAQPEKRRPNLACFTAASTQWTALSS